MPSRKKTGRSDKAARHVRPYHTMLKTPAWKSLTANARAIYVEIASRYGGPGSNNGRIPYSVRDAANSLKIGKTTAANGADFSFTARVPENPDTEDDGFTFTKKPSIIEHKAYRDIWGGAQTHLGAYLKWFYETVVLLHELLHEDGSIYVHLDWHVSFYAKTILDEVFGPERFLNEIVWKRQTAKGDVTQGAKHMGRIHDPFFSTLKQKITLGTFNTLLMTRIMSTRHTEVRMPMDVGIL
jgi:hypothetical protein